jgi:hypothetical protein
MTSSWKELYHAAVSSTDETTLATLVPQAESAIAKRLQQLTGQETPECDELFRAAGALLLLKHERLNDGIAA